MNEIRGQDDKKGREAADESGDLLAKEITTEKIRRALKQTKRGKAVGENGIPNEFLKEGGEVVVGKTEYLFNVMREEEYVPKVRRVDDSAAGYGGGGGGGGLHSDLQFAFSEGRSEMEAVDILGEIIEIGRREGRNYKLGFLDIRKATRCWEMCYGISWGRLVIGGGGFLRLIQRLYDDNQSNFRLGGIRGRRMGRNGGWRQGCVLSPFLFAMYIYIFEPRHFVKSA